jgi:hypothetical protein
MTTKPTYRVTVGEGVLDPLEGILSPLDEICAINQIYLQLPIAHKPIARTKGQRPRMKVRRGHFDWCGVYFNYVQVGSRLLVVDLWSEHERDGTVPRVSDTVIGDVIGEWEPCVCG